MVGVRGGIDQRDRRIGAEMPGQIERQLHAGREFRETLVDAELEIERAVLMPQHDARLRPACRRRAASRSRTGRCSASAGVARRMKAASPSSCASAVPRLAFQPLASSARKVSSARRDIAGRARHLEMDLAMLGQAVALAAQLLQLLCAERIAQQFIGVARRVEAGAHMGLQHARLHAVALAAPRVKAFIAAPSSARRAGPAHARRPARACLQQCRGRVSGWSRSSSGVQSVP